MMIKTQSRPNGVRLVRSSDSDKVALYKLMYSDRLCRPGSTSTLEVQTDS